MPTWDGWSVGEIIGQVSEAHNHGCVGGPVLNDADITLTTGRQQPWVEQLSRKNGLARCPFCILEDASRSIVILLRR